MLVAVQKLKSQLETILRHIKRLVFVVKELLSGIVDEVIYHNELVKSTIGAAVIGDNKVFFKIMPKERANGEIEGYNQLTGYPMPSLISRHESGDKSVLLYEYEETIGDNEGLLTDAIFSDGINVNMDEINAIQQSIFLKTLVQEKGECPNDFLFLERIKPGGRYDMWYPDLEERNFVVNGGEEISLDSIVGSIRKFHETYTERFKVLSPGDPSEVNIGTKPVFFDYEMGGMNDFIGETAVFLYGMLMEGSYFSPKYHPQAYHMHENVLSTISDHEPKQLSYNTSQNTTQIDFELQIPEVRQMLIQNYMGDVVKPVLDKAGISDFHGMLKHYLVPRIICVHDPNKLNKDDSHLSLGLAVELFQNPAKYFPLK